jgi:molybdopterin converting factor small subunit
MPKIKIDLHAWLAPCRCAQEKDEDQDKPCLELDVAPDATARQVLQDLAKRYAFVDQCVVSAQTGQHQGGALLVLNGRLLELAGGLDTTFNTGDVLDIVPPYTGG